MRVASILVALVMLATPMSADTPISLKVSPLFSRAPAYIRVAIIIERDPSNRLACIDIEGDTGFSRSSCWEYDGRYQTVLDYKDVPAGNYAAVASIEHTNRRTDHTATINFSVLD